MGRFINRKEEHELIKEFGKESESNCILLAMDFTEVEYETEILVL